MMKRFDPVSKSSPHIAQYIDFHLNMRRFFLREIQVAPRSKLFTPEKIILLCGANL
jgi:hypothetical protein